MQQVKDRLEADGSPQLTVVWVERDGDDVLFSTLAGRRKAQNWERDARAAVLIFDPTDPHAYVEVRRRVALTDDPTGSLIHELARKYTGADCSAAGRRPGDRPGDCGARLQPVIAPVALCR